MTEPRTRRERQRQATFEEIVEVARSLIRREEDMSLRAVASDMGLTAPALYRYVDNAADLRALVTRAIMDDVVVAMAYARDRYDADDPAARIVASAAAFRAWALGNPTEYRLCFADIDPSCQHRPVAAEGFSSHFGAQFLDLHQRGLLRLPPLEAIDPEFLAWAQQEHSDEEDALNLPMTGPDAVRGMWLFKLAWARLYGTITLEVFGHIDEGLIRSGVVFAALMHDTITDIGLGDDWDRLLQISRETQAHLDARAAS